MNKTILQSFLTILLVLSIIFLIVCLGQPWELRYLIQDILEDIYDSQRIRSGIDPINFVMIWENIISGLIFISCTCLICLSYLVSKK